MQIRDNVRRRRRERIEKLIGQQPAGQQDDGLLPIDARIVTPDIELPGDNAPVIPPISSLLPDPDQETDPEKWWKEHERRRLAAGPVWAGVGKITPARGSAPRNPVRSSSSFARSFALRLAAAALLYGAVWGWFASGLPGSREAKVWTADALTRDMDFRAIEVWYERTFGGSPAFLPIFRSKDEIQPVSGAWNREQAVQPVDGRIVQTFAQDGSGVRIAAAGGSIVKSVYAGRILAVTTEEDGKSTVLVQHAGRIVTVYGNLEAPAVKAGVWAEAGQRLGSIPAPLDDGGESLLYFAVKQNGKTMDPAEVVPFD